MTLISATLRNAVVRRAGNRCEYCHLSQDSQVATFPVDHILPVAREGPTQLENLALACPRCNSRKWKHAESVNPQTGQSVALFNPRTQNWRDHFRWSPGNAEKIEPISETGRATVELLELNSDRHLAIRLLLIVLDLHPPPEDVS